MIELYGIKSCDTCRKALKSLRESAKEVTFHDIRETPLEAATLARFHAEFGADLINTRSTTWRGLDEAARERAPLDLLAEHPTLMKRPVIDDGDRLHMGWTPQVRAALGQA